MTSGMDDLRLRPGISTVPDMLSIASGDALAIMFTNEPAAVDTAEVAELMKVLAVSWSAMVLFYKGFGRFNKVRCFRIIQEQACPRLN